MSRGFALRAGAALLAIAIASGQPQDAGNLTVAAGDMSAVISFTSYDPSAVSFEG